ncbi:MAG: hypothetical protein CL424_03985 [Acidimicrobiaceae bacterium]|nr:hypothetical protein [Acidimicrobiaceae bacterium]
MTVIDGLDEVVGRSGLESNGASTVAVQLLTQPSESARVRVESGDGQSAEFPVPAERPNGCVSDADGSPPESSGPQDDVSFRVVSRPIGGSGGDWIGWAVDESQLGSLMTQFDRVGTGDPIDFESEIALLVSIGRNECGPLFAGLDVVDDVIQPRTTTTGATSCDDYLAYETVVLAVPRTELDTTVAVGFRYPVTIDDEGSVVRFEQATGRFMSMGDEFSVTGVERSCTATDAAAIRARGIAPTVIDVDAELLVYGDVRAGPVRDTFGPDESSVLITVPDGVDLMQPIAVSVRTADGSRSIDLPPLAPSAIGDDPTCP